MLPSHAHSLRFPAVIYLIIWKMELKWRNSIGSVDPIKIFNGGLWYLIILSSSSCNWKGHIWTYCTSSVPFYRNLPNINIHVSLNFRHPLLENHLTSLNLDVAIIIVQSSNEHLCFWGQLEHPRVVDTATAFWYPVPSKTDALSRQ